MWHHCIHKIDPFLRAHHEGLNSQVHTDSGVVYDGQPWQPSRVHTASVVYDDQPGQPSRMHTDSVVYDGQPGQPSGIRRQVFSYSYQ